MAAPVVDGVVAVPVFGREPLAAMPVAMRNRAAFSMNIGVVVAMAAAGAAVLRALPRTIRTLLGEGAKGIMENVFSVLTPEQFVYIGVNEMDPAEEHYVKKHRIDLVPGPDLTLILESIAGKKKRYVYIHFDLDVLTEKEFSHTPFPNRNGFTVAAALEIVRKLKKDFEVVGSSVTESIADSFEKLRPVEELLKELISGEKS